MYCTNCGNRLPEEARFCSVCGAPVAADAAWRDSTSQPPVPPEAPEPAPTPTFAPTPSPTPPGPPGPAQFPPAMQPSPYPGGGRPNRNALWASIVAAVVIVLAGVAVLVVMLLRDRDTEQASDTTVIVSSTATTRPLTSTTERVTTTEAPSTTSSSTTVFAGPPGDSPGQWVEQEIPDFPGEMWSAAISDEVLVVRTQSGDKPELYAYLLQSGDIVRLPIDYTEVWSVSVSGSLVVWWEGEFDPNTYQRKEAHVYAFSLPSGPKVEVATGVRGAAYYPQVAWPWVTWAEEQSWPENPEEYFEETIYGVQVDQQGNPTGNPAELVGSALAFAMGDAVWIYSVSSTHLAWENATPQEGLAGTYIMDLATFTPRKIGQNAWRPSLAEGVLVYWEDGLHWADPQRLQPTLLDPNGDFPTAAPTYAAYYRYPPDSPGGQYEVVARGYSGAHEQVLATTSVAPHFSAPIAAAGSYLAVALDEGLRLFRWQPEGAK